MATTAPAMSTEEVKAKAKAMMPQAMEDLRAFVANASVAFPGFPSEPVHGMTVRGLPPCAPDGPGDPYTTEPGVESANNWDNRSRDNIHGAGIGLDVQLIPGRLRGQLQDTFSKTDGRWVYASPIGGATDLNRFDPAPAEQVDDTSWHVLNPELELRLTERLAVTAAVLGTNDGPFPTLPTRGSQTSPC